MLKKTKKKKNKIDAQLRQELVTEDWVVIASSRGKRPFNPGKTKPAWSTEEIAEQNERQCIFCDPVKSKQKKDVLIYKTEKGDWSLRVFPNKFPAFDVPANIKFNHFEEGPYLWKEAAGYHEVIVTRDHYKHIGQMDPIKVAEVLDAYQTRYLDLMNRKSVHYIEIFHNHGAKAGGSIFHPHSQLITVPVISPYINLELKGAERYYQANRNCVYCTILEWELEQQKRIVFENDDFVAFTPFASRSAFEVWVMPKKHQPYFERSTDQEKVLGGEALQKAIEKIGKVVGEPAYNFYLHTAPCDGKDYPHYHWHIEILPKTSIWAGFELSTGIEISAIEPEKAAKQLKKV